MNTPTRVDVPDGLDWEHWVDRWDKMQDRYIPQREQRSALMVSLIHETQPTVSRVLDLGCATGSTMLPVLKAFPQADVIGIDYDPTLLVLARRRLGHWAARARLVEADLRDESWARGIDSQYDAVISATTLHWLAPEQIDRVYRQICQILRAGGIFLNADHVASDHAPLQQAWEKYKTDIIYHESSESMESWDSFWDDYGSALGMDIRDFHRRLRGDWQGSEEGLPLIWHLDRLRENGFSSIDCYWRCAGDAVYGGFRR